MLRYLITTLLLIGFLPQLYAQRPVVVSSPDRQIVLSVSNGGDGSVAYRVTYKGKRVIEPSTLGFTLSKPAVSLTKFTITAVDSSVTDET